MFMIAKILSNSPDAPDLGGKCWAPLHLWRIAEISLFTIVLFQLALAEMTLSRCFGVE